jgi:hypothetical protein
MRRMLGFSMTAMTFISAPHFGHTVGSTSLDDRQESVRQKTGPGAFARIDGYFFISIP